ncbi:MAG: Wzz/FepE/Etk N-terminal domain-containing protein [Actinobacteria bacterium]|nr:Wzz/FepE/Etk N-terminal domain-containing protein [Actinomycetota bacterium]
MSSNNNIKKKGEVELREIGRVFIKKIWWFVGTFLIILVAVVLFTFLRTPQYGLTSTLVISSINQTYYQTLLEYFPEKTVKLVSISNLTESEKIQSDSMLDALEENLSFDIDRGELEDSIYINSEKGGILNLTTVYKDEKSTFELNDVLLGLYLEEIDLKIDQAYNGLLSGIDQKMLDIYDEIEKLDSDSIEGKKEIELKYETYYKLKESRDILVENESFFIDRIRVSKGPEISDVYKYFSIKRDIVFGFFFAVAIGILAAFAVNYFQSLKK